MRINRLSIEGLRNLANAGIRGLSRLNVFVGDNGAGKTSILEAIHILGSARSFRSRETKFLVMRGESAFVVYGEISGPNGDLSRAAVEKTTSGDGRLRLDGTPIYSTAPLAELLPIIVLSPDMFTFLDGGPVFRRSFIDWGVFHVEHGFSGLWGRYQKALNQRNKLLKSDTLDASMLTVWDEQLAALGEEVNAARKRYYELFLKEYHSLMSEVLSWDVPSVSFYKGWPAELSFLDALQAATELDISRGYTSVGPQRADVRIRVGRHSADKVLSRGQQKMLIVLSRIAQARLIKRLSGKLSVFLVDDMMSELDSANIALVLRLLNDDDNQVFLTALDSGWLGSALDQSGFDASEVQVFHVKHGEVFQ